MATQVRQPMFACRIENYNPPGATPYVAKLNSTFRSTLQAAIDYAVDHPGVVDIVELSTDKFEVVWVRPAEETSQAD